MLVIGASLELGCWNLERRYVLRLTAEGIIPVMVLPNNQCMNIVRAFVSINTLKIHEMPNHGIAIRDAHCTKNIARFVCAFERHPNVVAFCERNLRGPGRAHFHHASETQRQQLRFRNLLHHPNKLFLNELETGNRTVKLLSRFGVSQRRFITINRPPQSHPTQYPPAPAKDKIVVRAAQKPWAGGSRPVSGNFRTNTPTCVTCAG